MAQPTDLQSDHSKHSLRLNVGNALNSPVRIIGGPQVGILCIVNSIPIELWFITEQYAMKNPSMYKHPLAELNMKIITIRLKSLHSLQMITI
jgi:hypothetical protein